MTSLISWLAVDGAAPSAIYMASDSRISWGQFGSWDAGRKIFWCRASPDIFGYCGDVVFPSLALSQITESIDAGLLFCSEQTADERHQEILNLLRTCLDRSQAPLVEYFQILHLSRSGSGRTAQYHAWETSFRRSDQSWSDDRIPINSSASSLISALGTGRGMFIDQKALWEGSESAGTSRAIFSSFWESVSGKADQFSGGPVQLVGMYNSTFPKPFGIIENGQRMLNGLPISRGENASAIEWRDLLFQRMNGETMMLEKDAQRHFPRRAKKLKPGA